MTSARGSIVVTPRTQTTEQIPVQRVQPDLTGLRFSFLTVEGKAHPTRNIWTCLCDCGNRADVWGHNLLRGNNKSCGCHVRRILASGIALKHGATRGHDKSRTYETWRAMINRCHRPYSTNFKEYGGRGITVCDRWQGTDGFSNFLADMGERPTGMTLDRIDPFGNYELGNVRWADAKTQANNKRRNWCGWCGRHGHAATRCKATNQ